MMTAPVSVEMTNENRREEGSKRLGTYMLQGWVLTDVPCTKPGCDMPTLRAKDDRTKYVCALCDDPRPIPPVRNVGRPSAMVADDDDIEELDEEEDADEAMDDFEMAPLTPAEADRISRRREASDRASRLMGQRLLSGWTMLAETCNSRSCSELGVPMMKRGDVTVCVLCETVQTSEPQQEEVVQATSTSPPEPPTSVIEAVASTSVISRSIPQSLSVPSTLSAPKPNLKRPAPSTVDESMDDDDAIDQLLGSTSGPDIVVDSTVETLLSRMAVLKESLARAKGPRETLEICRAIEGCADAVRACRAIKSVGF